jgi:hypothetical protein
MFGKSTDGVILNGASPRAIPGLCVDTGDGFIVQVSRSLLTLSVCTVEEVRAVVSHFDSLFQFAVSLHISHNRLFLVVDFEFGMTRTYRMVYANGKPDAVCFISDFSWNDIPRSVVSGVHWIIATAAVDYLVLWEIFSGAIHRSVGTNGKIIDLAFDEEHGVWAATATEVQLYSINGELIGAAPIPHRPSRIEAIQLHSSQTPRAAILGTVSGEVLLLQANFATRKIDIKDLQSRHSARIVNIVVQKGCKLFLTIDERGIPFAWSAIGLGGQGLLPEVHEECQLCEGVPTELCASCKRAVCPACQIEGTCSLCVALSYVI